MPSIDWTEQCRDEFPMSAGWLDYPYDGSFTLEDIIPALNEATRMEGIEGEQ